MGTPLRPSLFDVEIALEVLEGVGEVSVVVFGDQKLWELAELK